MLKNNRQQDIPRLDFIGIGAPRAGTTWISTCLNEHPEICLSKPKEIDFFNQKHSFIIKHGFNYRKGFSWYAKHFRHCLPNQKKGEFSVSYLADKKAAELIYKHYPKIKLIICLRNPVDQLWSNYQVSLAHLPEYPDLKTALKKLPDFINRSLYGQNIKYYLNFFKLDQLFFLFYEEFSQNPLKYIKKLYHWLEVDDSFIPPSLRKRINTSQEKNGFLRKTSLRFFSKLEKVPAYNLVQWLKKIGLIQLAKKVDKIISSKRTNTHLTKILRSELKTIFQNDISDLEKILNKNLDIWKK